MLRVLMLITDLQPGGSPMRIVRLARKLRELDIEPIVGCLAPKGPLHEELEQAGIANFACGARSAWDVSAVRRLSWVIKECQPDVIHSTLFHANMAARLCNSWRYAGPLITSSVTMEIERRWHNPLEALTMGMSDLHIANSRAVADHLANQSGVGPRKLRMIPNGIDLQAVDTHLPIDRAAFDLPKDIPLFAWAGRLDPIKNLPTFIDVVDRVRRVRQVRAVILGEGPKRGELEQLIHDRRLKECICLGGWSSQVIGWLKAADLLLFPSLTEGSSNVILEAMACGCPVVASDIDACRELLADGRGVLCPAKSSASFANAVLNILETPSLSARRVRTARRYVQATHDLGDIAGEWKQLYSYLVHLK